MPGNHYLTSTIAVFPILARVVGCDTAGAVMALFQLHHLNTPFQKDDSQWTIYLQNVQGQCTGISYLKYVMYMEMFL